MISIQCLNTCCGVFHCGKRVGYSSEGYGVFRRWIWGTPLLVIPLLDMLLIGSDIEYIKLEDIHSYLRWCVLSWVVLFWGRWVSWVGVLS